jgi:hypothetical protein
MRRTVLATLGLALGAFPALPAIGQVPEETLQSISAPDKVETRIGALEFDDGVPSAETAQTVSNALDFTRALNVYNNSFRGASAYALRQGFHSIGAEDNTGVLIFSELMDSSSLFLTGNADTIYYLATLDLTNGPMVIEQPTGGSAPSTTCGFSG